MDQYIGKLLDNRYEIIERIGTGGMAVVYKGRDHRLNRLVAVKILKEELAQDAEFRRRFHDESQAVAMLSHPNIMAVYDVSHSTELDYIVMELIDGITLKQYMQKKGGKLAWREALHFITQIMKALSHAHSRGIIHRDIKPHNMMVLRDGSLKVADFGIARLTSAAQATLTQEALGSVHYISPEQARGSHIDARSDIYSAGVVLYEMITGRLPYEGESPVAVAIQHINSIPLSPREIDPEIPEALEAITMKAMASDVNQRYVSADAMLMDLEEFRKNPSINFDYTPADLLIADGDEPTQILGANTPHTVRSQPVHDDGDLMELLSSLAHVKTEYDKVAGALEEVKSTGYGIVVPSTDELVLEEPEIVKQGGRYGVRLKASAPSIHMIRADIETEVSPIVGNEKQSEEMVNFLLQEFEGDTKAIWQSNIFGKSFHELVSEDLNGKLKRMPDDARAKLQETLQRIINEGSGGLICIIL